MTNKITIGDDEFIPLFSEEQIQNRIKELALKISEDYKSTVPIFIGVLNGSFLFMSDLIRYQHAYMAAAKLITTAQEMLDTILQAV